MTPRSLLILALTVGALTLASCSDTTTEPDKPPDAEATLATATTALAFYQVSAGGGHTCGITADNRLYCWGYNYNGQLGDGTTTNKSRPFAVGGALQFRQVSAAISSGHTCGLTTDYRLYCWGYNAQGQLGDGTTVPRLSPVAVAGGYKFRSVDGGSSHTCAVGYSDNRAYCWGNNGSGQLGNGTTGGRLVPTATSGTIRFRQVSTGVDHTCGVSTENRAFCWGGNGEGQIGDSSNATQRLTPVRVATTRRFRQLDSGRYHACAVSAADNRAFCWGRGLEGQLGNGKRYLSFWPRAVAGGLSFDRVSAGAEYTCGETTGNRAYCWGWNVLGMLGDGTTTTRLTPVAVKGNLFFRQLSAGGGHTCGKTADSVAYCWGSNDSGELGDGTTTDRLTPRAVAGPM
jgi:alpha-tubulin suppressor-like RCC1 family protein